MDATSALICILLAALLFLLWELWEIDRTLDGLLDVLLTLDELEEKGTDSE